LTSVEQLLVEHVCRGEWLDLAADDEAVDEAAMRSWGESRTCSAAVIRDILRGRLVVDPDPHGLRLRGAKITGRLDLESLTTHVNVELKDCLLEEGILARDAHLARFALAGCQIEHPADPPLDAFHMTCSTLSLAGARVIGHTGDGAVRLTTAHISGRLTCAGAHLSNDAGPALHADGLQVDQDMFLSGNFIATASAVNGAVRLPGAHIGGQLDCTFAGLHNDSGSGLFADGLQVDQDMFLDDAFGANGSGADGAVRLWGAHIGGSLDCSRAGFRNDSGPALSAFSLQVGLGLFFIDFHAYGGGDDPVIDLLGARVGGAFVFVPTVLEHKDDPHRRLSVDGLTYASVPKGPLDWRDLLREGTSVYAAQPYQYLAAAYWALGDDRQARETLMRQRDDQLARAHPSRWEWLWGKITKVTLGYGYQPWRALLFLAGVVAASCLLAWLLGAHGALTQTNKTATAGQSCTVVQQLSVGVDLNLPVGTSLARAGCDLTTDSTSTTAAWLSGVGWVLRILAWAFAALFFAGFTSAVRKT
jgi:hypothetical protein